MRAFICFTISVVLGIGCSGNADIDHARSSAVVSAAPAVSPKECVEMFSASIYAACQEADGGVCARPACLAAVPRAAFAATLHACLEGQPAPLTCATVALACPPLLTADQCALGTAYAQAACE